MSAAKYNVLDDEGAVINTILADQAFMDAVHPGHYSLAPADAAHVPPKSWTAIDFYSLIPASVRIAIRTLAKTDTTAEDFMRTLDNRIAASGRVVVTDPDLVAGFAYLQANPPGSPCLTPDQAAAILAG